MRKLIYVTALLLLAPALAAAHCDALDGPVVQAAQKALAAGDVAPVLRWVPAGAEAEVRAAFAKARSVRAQGGDAQQVADAYFFETVVRLHRAGEGEPFTGLKPAGHTDAFAALVDEAIAARSGKKLEKELTAEVRRALHQRLERVLALERDADKSVEAGRAYVAAYVELLHLAEALTRAAGPAAHGHVHASTE